MGREKKTEQFVEKIFHFRLQATTSQPQLSCVLATIAPIWAQIPSVIASLVCWKRVNRYSYHAILRCRAHLFQCIWRSTSRQRSRFARHLSTPIKLFPLSAVQHSETSLQALSPHTMESATFSTTANRWTSVTHCNSVDRAVEHWSTSQIPLCKASSAGSCGGVIAVMSHRNTGWEQWDQMKIATHGNGLEAMTCQFHSGICPVVMRIALDTMAQRAGSGATQTATLNSTLSANINQRLVADQNSHQIPQWLQQRASMWAQVSNINATRVICLSVHPQELASRLDSTTNSLQSASTSNAACLPQFQLALMNLWTDQSAIWAKLPTNVMRAIKCLVVLCSHVTLMRGNFLPLSCRFLLILL